MGSVKLKPLKADQLGDLYDHWYNNKMWPGGSFFHAAIQSADDLGKAHESGTFHAFEIKKGKKAQLFAIAVTSEDHLPHIDLYPATVDEELTPELGQAALEALIGWVFENTEVPTVHKYLDDEISPIHAKFEEWGFSAIESEESGDGNAWKVFALNRDAFSGSLGG